MTEESHWQAWVDSAPDEWDWLDIIDNYRPPYGPDPLDIRKREIEDEMI